MKTSYEVRISDWSSDFCSSDRNLTVSFSLTRHCMPMLSKAKDASVVFTSDRHGREPRPFGGAYSISKAGIEQLAQMWAAELQSNKNLRINSYNPGHMRTNRKSVE